MHIADFIASQIAAPLLRKASGLRGRGYLARKFHAYRKMPNRETADIHFQMNNGLKVCLPSNSTQTWSTLFTGEYDRSSIEYLDQFIEKDSIVLDIGGCYGLYTLEMVKFVRQKNSKIIVFEPLPANLRYLRKNVELNDLSDVIEVFPYGLGDENKKTHMSSTEGSSGNSYLVESDNVPDFAGPLIDIDIRCLDQIDDFAKSVGDRRVSFIKMDVEGFELNALNGASKFLQKHRPIIFGEFNIYWMGHYGFDPSADVKDWAKNNNYQLHEIFEKPRSFMSDQHSFYAEELADDQKRTREPLLLKSL